MSKIDRLSSWISHVQVKVVITVPNQGDLDIAGTQVTYARRLGRG